MLVHRFSIDGFPHLVEAYPAAGADKVILKKVVRGVAVELYRSEFEPCASLAGNLLRELARLATREAKGGPPDGEREFEHGGKRWKTKLSPPRVLEQVGVETDQWMLVGQGTPDIPPFEVLARWFHVAGIEEGKRTATARVAELEAQLAAEKDRANVAADMVARLDGYEKRFASDERERQRLLSECGGLRKQLRDLEARHAEAFENFAAGCAAGAAAVTKAIMGADVELAEP